MHDNDDETAGVQKARVRFATGRVSNAKIFWRQNVFHFTFLLGFLVAANAEKAATWLNGRTLNGATLAAVRERAPQTLQRSRLIVRNVAFGATDDDVKTMFGRVGQVLEVCKKNDFFFEFEFFFFLNFKDFIASS